MSLRAYWFDCKVDLKHGQSDKLSSPGVSWDFVRRVTLLVCDVLDEQGLCAAMQQVGASTIKHITPAMVQAA